jgi:PAS domain S-box-containing protein
MTRPSVTPSQWAFLSNHGQVLVAVADDPKVRIRDIAERVGITERATQSLLNDLVAGEYLSRERVGRRNTYTVNPKQSLRHPALAQSQIGALLTSLVPWKHEESAPAEQPVDGSVAANEPGRAQHRPSVVARSILSLEETTQALDKLTTLARTHIDVPICFISVISGDEQIVKSSEGLPDGIEHSPLPLDDTDFNHMATDRAPLVIPDTEQHPRLRQATTRLGIRAYAAIPLVTNSGTVLGSFCVADLQPRQWSEQDVRLLTSIAAAAGAQAEVGIISDRHRETATRYRALLDSLPETVILVVDEDLRFQVASGDSLKQSGFDPDRLLGQTLDEALPPEQANRLRPHYQAGLRGERHEFSHTGTAGKSYSIEILPLAEPDGKIRSVMALGREQLIFGRQDHWDADRLRALIENIPGAIYRCSADPNWTMAFISDQIQEITGYPSSDFIEDHARTYASVIHPSDRELVEQTVTNAVTAAQPFIIEYRIITRNNTTRWVRERGRGIYDEDGNVLFLDGAIFHITEQTRRLATGKAA